MGAVYLSLPHMPGASSILCICQLKTLAAEDILEKAVCVMASAPCRITLMMISPTPRIKFALTLLLPSVVACVQLPSNCLQVSHQSLRQQGSFQEVRFVLKRIKNHSKVRSAGCQDSLALPLLFLTLGGACVLPLHKWQLLCCACSAC